MTTPTARLDITKEGNVHGSLGKERHVERTVLAAAVGFGLRGSHSAATPQGESRGLKKKTTATHSYLPLIFYQGFGLFKSKLKLGSEGDY